MNISLISLHILSLHSLSPFYTIGIQNQKRISTLFNSQFTHSFTSIIYSSTNYHSTTIHNNKFIRMLHTPLVFTSDSIYEGKCAQGYKCCISKDYYFKPNEIISNINITNKSFPDGFDNPNAFFVDDQCGDIKITNCQFIECKTGGDHGGGIFIEEYCIVILHRCIFDKCRSKINGGAGAIVKKMGFKDVNTINDPDHEQTKRIDIQYTCFQGCYTTKGDGYGTALILGAESVTFFYASTIECPPSSLNKQKGAQFDILSDSISSQFINATGGIAVFCGSLEYRKAKSGFFRYQTITNLECKYAMSFTSVEIDNLSITSCNVYNNTIKMVEGESIGKNSHPALVFVRNNDLLVENFYFSQNKLCEEAKFASKEIGNTLKITLRNCFADTSNSGLWNFDYVKTVDCDFADKDIKTFPLRQLSLGLCQGDVEPGNMIITSLFTASSSFSPSDFYTRSSDFSKSEAFLPTNNLDQSRPFSPSKKFSQSSLFSNSDCFSLSNLFTESKATIPLDRWLGDDSKKDNKTTIIGASVGAVAGLAIIAAIIAFFLIRKRRSLLEDAANVVNETNESVTNDNALKSVMDKDDPFAEDFNHDLPDIN